MATNYYKLVTGDTFKYWVFQDSVGDLYKMEFSGSTFVKCSGKPSPDTEAQVQEMEPETIDENTFMEEAGAPISEYVSRLGGVPQKPPA